MQCREDQVAKEEAIPELLQQQQRRGFRPEK
jgi:hypothetical protein